MDTAQIYNLLYYFTEKSQLILPDDNRCVNNTDHQYADDWRFEIDEADALTRSIACLPIIYKDILTLKYVQEFSNEEIGKVLGITESTVRKRLERAKKKSSNF